MANNRMFLYCPPCNAALYLGKTYLHGYFRNTNDLQDEFVKWTEAHAHGDTGVQFELRFDTHPDKTRVLPLDTKGLTTLRCSGATRGSER